MTPVAVKPSSWLMKGIQIGKVNNLNLFKLTDELGLRMEELQNKTNADSLTAAEAAELEAIGELVIIVSYLNGMIANEAQQSPEIETWEQRIEKN